ncbi:MAG: sterol desaturase family protein [Nitrospirales bacterium]|nr:sterol desaturase family protein [Nitrospirales bacterium]
MVSDGIRMKTLFPRSSRHTPTPADTHQGIRQKRVPAWVNGMLIIGTFFFLFWQERRRPLRPAVESISKRTGRNLMMAGITAITLQMTERPLISRLSRLVTRRRIGMLKSLPLPFWLEVPLAVILMDYTLYWWHVLTHRVSCLWRFHVVHHIDVDLDASTAIRFHFTEMVISVVWRAGQVAFIGVSPLPLSIWQTLLLVSVLFHHSNIALPIRMERWLVKLIVTPRMHGIHHSDRRKETDSNWSSGLTFWDRLHGTLKLDVPQESINIGIPAYQKGPEVSLPHLLLIPFKSQRPSWLPATHTIEQSSP